MTKNIFVRKTSDVRETGQSGPAKFFLATVASVSGEEGLTIIPDGQSEAVPKKYKILVSGSAPDVGDRVIVMKHSGTCIILGTVGIPDDIPGDSDKVSKSGDTMTGALTMYGADINLRSTANTIGTVPATSAADRRVYFRDKLNTVFGKLQSIFLNDGRVGMQLGTQRTVNGSLVENNVSLYIDASGNRSVTFTQIAAWRAALGLGTSGALPITAAQGGTGATSAAGHAVFAGPNSTTAAAPSFRALVADDIPSLNASKIGAGTLPVARGGTGTASAAGHAVFAGPNGTTAGAPSFRALSAADITEGTLPIARGGTGSTGVTVETNAANIATAGAGFTITSAFYYSWGKLATLWLGLKTTAAKTVTVSDTIATIVSGKRPALVAPVQVWVSTQYAAVIQSSGVMNMNAASLSSGASLTFVAVYLLP